MQGRYPCCACFSSEIMFSIQVLAWLLCRLSILVLPPALGPEIPSHPKPRDLLSLVVVTSPRVT